jgi:hypothetical protein
VRDVDDDDDDDARDDARSGRRCIRVLPTSRDAMRDDATRAGTRATRED